MKATELVRWREQHPKYTYWCGTLLGGCGEPLTDRLYQAKVCHFAHHPHHTCTRRANGEDSADHLFLKRALHEWLRSQRLQGTVRLSRTDASPGEAIDVDLRNSQRRLRFRLRPGSAGTVSGETEDPGREKVDWIFGLGVPVPDRFFDEGGYIFRIRFETKEAKRCPYLGVQQRSTAIKWAPFAEAVLTGEGLTTPAVEEVRAARIATPGSVTVTDLPSGAAATKSRVTRHMSWEELVIALREALELDARWGTRPTWKRLGQMIGTDFTPLSGADIRDLLTEVDNSFPQNDPVLSALIRTDAGEPLPYLDSILEALGLGLPSSASHLKRWSQREADRAFAKYTIPPRTMPPALPLDAAVPEVFVDLPNPSRRRAGARSRRGGTTEVRDRTRDDRRLLERLITQGQELAINAPGKVRDRLKHEVRSSRRLLRDTQRTKLNERGHRLLREAIAQLESTIAEAKTGAQRRQKSDDGKLQSPSPEASKPGQQQRAARPQKAQPTAVPAPGRDLRQRLIEVARAGGTTHWPLLAGGKNTPQEVRHVLLSQIEDGSNHGAPLLSSLVVAPGGGPPPYFREILKDVGLAVPRSDEALLRIWHREQERAHAAYANPPRPAPPRLVPKAAADVVRRLD
ncbi:competence protein CoiA family protein [Streptomyces flavidovirens]|uniref:competence protein CoiA family protein n=1 Tax=Streptomyces flavidovirens TaxID=67298 RepID=UPI0034131566